MFAVLRRGAIVLGNSSRRSRPSSVAVQNAANKYMFGRNLAWGKPKKPVDICLDLEEDETSMTYDPSQPAPSGMEYDPSPNSLIMRLEDKINEPVLPILHKWIKDGKETPDRLAAAMNRLKWLGRFKHALEISDFVMHERPMLVQKFHYLNHLELLGRCKSMKEAEEFLKKMPRHYSRTEAAQLIMFENYITHEAVHNAKLVLRVMKNQGYLTTPNQYNKLFKLCAKRNKGDKVPMLLKDMKDLCIAPDVETYEILIDMKASSGDINGMLRLFNKMQSDGDGRPQAGINCALASGYVKAGNYKEAVKYLEQVEQDEDFKTSRKLHDKVIALYAAMGKVQEVDKVWRFSKRFPFISGNSYTNIIAAYEKVGQVAKAEEVFFELEKRGNVSTRHYNALLKVFSDRNQMQKSEKLLDRMNRFDVRMNHNTYHHLITGYIRSGNQQMAVEAMKKMLNENVKPSYETMLLVLQLHAENGNVDSAEELFQNMKRECYSKNVKVYNSLLKTYVRAGKHAYRFLQRMALDKVDPDTITYGLLNKMKPIPKLTETPVPVPSSKKPNPY